MLHFAFRVLCMFRVIDDFAFDKTSDNGKMFTYVRDNGILWVKLHTTVLIIQPKGWAKKYGTAYSVSGTRNI